MDFDDTRRAERWTSADRCRVQGEPVQRRLAAYVASAGTTVSVHTARAWRADVDIFCAWCARDDRAALPADDATVVAFMDAMAQSRSPATVRRYVSSVSALHRVLREVNPAATESVKRALKRLRVHRGGRGDAPGRSVQALTWALCQRLIDASTDRLIDARNRALLAVAYDTLLRRSQLVALEVDGLSVNADGSATLRLRGADPDAQPPPGTVALARDTLAHVERWLERAGIREGRLFRSVPKHGRLGEALHPSQIPRIYKAMARRAGLAPEAVHGISAHSTRVGALKDMIADGVKLPALLRAGRWKSADAVQRYADIDGS